MQIHSLELQRFRNYPELKIQFTGQASLFLGANGMGKSNLLEAICLVLTGHSFRPMDELVQKGAEEGAVVKAEVSDRQGSSSVLISVADHKRALKMDGRRISGPRLNARFGCCVFSPESLGIVKEGPQVRRQTIDDIALSLRPLSARVYSEFLKALRLRNRLLRDWKEGNLPPSDARSVLESLEKPYLDLAVEVTLIRLDAIRRLEPLFKTKFSDILGVQNVDISVNYVISGDAAIAWNRNQVYDALLSRIRELEAAEAASGQSLVGPHRHDVQFLFEGKDARHFCSQGQQRALVLAMKLAQIALFREERGEFPILLLDDVFSELDIERRGNLLETLQGLQTQIFVTTTDVENVRFLRDRKPAIFDIDSGKLTIRDGISG